jgi:hypothetical protein
LVNDQPIDQPLSLTANPRLDAALQSGWEAWETAAKVAGPAGVLAWLSARLELPPDGGDITGPIEELLTATDPEQQAVARTELAEILEGDDDALADTLWEGVLAYGLDAGDADYVFEASSHLARIAEELGDPLAAAEYFIDFLNWRRQPDHGSEIEQVEVAYEEIVRLSELDEEPRATAIYAHRQAQYNRLAEADDERATAGDWETSPEPYSSWE